MPIYYLDQHKVATDIYNSIAILHYKEELSVKATKENIHLLKGLPSKDKHRHKKSKSMQTIIEINNVRNNQKVKKKSIGKKMQTDINSR